MSYRSRVYRILFCWLLVALVFLPSAASSLDYEPDGPNYIISAGWQHTCALKANGAVECWGRNSEGQATNQSGPYSQISAGSTHTCALTPLGNVDCWGLDQYGETEDKPGPFTQVSVGELHSCALTPAGAVDCWGYNGDGRATDQVGPYSQVDAGYFHTCALTMSGAVECWGDNFAGKAASQTGPFIQVSAGRSSTCALTPAGAADCWGQSAIDQTGPFTEISVGDINVCALTTTGAADCWGTLYSQSDDQDGPYVQISAGTSYNCAVLTNGAVDCWGNDNYRSSDREGPFHEVAAGESYTCARRFSGAVTCWPYDAPFHVWVDRPGPYTQVSVGKASACALTLGKNAECWHKLASSSNIIEGPFDQISHGYEHVCALKENQEVECWGRQSEGQSASPEGPFSQVSAGYYHTCALLAASDWTVEGDIECWGYNVSGQTYAPEGPYTQVSAGNNHTCALNPEGGVECWGDNTYGQSNYHAGPYSQVSAGWRSTCAVKDQEQVVECWGWFGNQAFTLPSIGVSQVSTGSGYACVLTLNLDAECWPEETYGQSFDQPGPYGFYASPVILDTILDSSPANPSNSADASFSISSPHLAATFECRLDDNLWTACISPVQYAGLADGSHTFRARARTASGHVDTTPAFYTWIIDAMPPETEITGGPADPTNSITASFTFSSTDPAATFECRLDGGGWSACTSPAVYSPLSDGQHTFEVRAKDAMNTLDPTPATYTWAIDRVGPDTIINSGPPTLSTNSTATFAFSSPEPTATFECWLDYVGNWSACSSPKEYADLGDGAHIFLVRARDLAGNVDTIPPSYNWTITTLPPNEPPNAPANPSPAHNAANVSVAANLSWTATDPNNDPLTHEVRFGTNNPPPQLIASQSETSHDPPGDLAYNTTYYWQVIADDGNGGVTPGPVWSFTTEDAPPLSFTLNPIADAYTSSSAPATNYGNATALRVKETSADFYTYLMFDPGALSCVEVDRATLRLYVTDAAANAGSVYPVASGWTETGIKWNNQPPISGTPLDTPGAAALNSWVEFDVTAGVALGAPFSFGIKGNVADVVAFASRQATQKPQLVIEYTELPGVAPTADFTGTPLSGNAPLAVAFTNESTGCPTSYLWDFGDGATSTDANPSHTYDDPGTYAVSLAAGNAYGDDTETKLAYVTVSEPPPEPDVFISPLANVTLGGNAATGADILRYQKNTNQWTMVYDGSVRATPKNINAFDLLDDGRLLLVFGVNQPITGLGTATPYDVVQFTPNTPGVFPLGPGTYEWFFQGKERGLSTTTEKIDALDYDEAGNRLLLSTVGAANVTLPGGTALKPADEDVFAFNRNTNLWQSPLVIDGSTMTGMAVEDINGLWDDPNSNDYFILIVGSFNLGGVKGTGKSIVKLTPNGGPTVYTPSIVQWLAPGATFPTTTLDGLSIMP